MNLIPACDKHLLHTCTVMYVLKVKYLSDWKSGDTCRIKNPTVSHLLLLSSDVPAACIYIFLSNDLCVKCLNVFEAKVYCLSRLSIFRLWNWLSTRAAHKRIKLLISLCAGIDEHFSSGFLEWDSLSEKIILERTMLPGRHKRGAGG